MKLGTIQNIAVHLLGIPSTIIHSIHHYPRSRRQRAWSFRRREDQGGISSQQHHQHCPEETPLPEEHDTQCLRPETVLQFSNALDVRAHDEGLYSNITMEIKLALLNMRKELFAMC